MDWAEKYRPQHLSDIVGNKEAARQMTKWAREWTSGTKPLLLYGKPGTGKTSSALALARDMDWELIELNASDQRTKGVIEKVAGAGASTGSLTGQGRKLIVLDEADNISGNADRGGAKAIVEVIKSSQQPIVLIANDAYGIDAAIRNLCEKVLFKAVAARSILPRLRDICTNEKITCDMSALADIADNSKGDIRSAVTTLYALTIGRDHLSEEELVTSKKDARATIFDLMAAVFGHGNYDLLSISRTVNEQPDTILQWIEGNAGILDDKSFTKAYSSISKADEFLGRVSKKQYYMLWRYASAMMLFGVHNAAGDNKSGGGFSRYNAPERWRRMSTAKKQKNSRNQLVSKIGNTTGTGVDSVRRSYLQPVSILAEQNPEYYARSLNLDYDMLDCLIQDSEVAKKVIKQIETERKEAEKELKKKQKAEAALLKKQKGTKRKVPEKSPEALSVESVEMHTEKTSGESSETKAPSQSTLFSFE